ncbi:MAG: substrate-binding domain-containing protein [Candidatus Riflebacteria bacterium]|nr:substrate-binding domain-containing protein [Candidatus Riflebacteria bacterium]
MRTPLGAWLGLVVGCVTVLPMTGCGQPGPETLRLATSTIPAPAVRSWLDQIVKLPRPFDASLSVTGSTTAIEQLLEGQLDLVVSSRRMSLNEFLVGQSRGREIHEVLIGFGIYQVLVNPRNPVSSLTLEQVGEIFSRRLQDWSEVGGPKLPIVCVYRKTLPGDLDLFFEKEVSMRFEPNRHGQGQGVVVAGDTAAIDAAVQADPGAIGYLLSTDPAPGVKSLAIQSRFSKTPLKPSVEAALSGQYPMLRPLYMYLDTAAPRAAEYFREFAESKRGRQLLAEAGFAPAPSTRTARNDPDQPVIMPDW